MIRVEGKDDTTDVGTFRRSNGCQCQHGQHCNENPLGGRTRMENHDLLRLLCHHASGYKRGETVVAHPRRPDVDGPGEQVVLLEVKTDCSRDRAWGDVVRAAERR